MAHVRKDTLTRTIDWAKHLRPFLKRKQARRERVAAKKEIENEQKPQ
jgi:hypothetical protein